MEDSVNVLKFAECRAKEIMTLMEEVTGNKGSFCLQKIPYHMRRRAASHNPKRLPRSLRLKKDDKTPAKKKKKHQCHKNLLEEYNSRQSADSSWLPTHIWFAKRFHMKKMWGYQLPLQATGKRFRASYRATVKKALVQDLSYFCCIELNGDQEKLLSQLSLMTDDSVGMNFASESYTDGTKEGYCFLYHPQCFPYGAIGPISFLWKPSYSPLKNCEQEQNSVSSQQLWIWCHPSIHEELVEVFISLFHLEKKPESQINSEQFHFASKTNFMKTKLHFRKEPIYASDDVTMVLLKNTLVRHRLIGPNALSILTSVLNLHYSSSGNVEVSSNTDKSSEMEVDEKCSASDQNLDKNQEIIHENSGSISKTENELSNILSAYASSKQNVWNYLTDTKSSYGVPLKTVIGLAVEDPRLYVVPSKSNHSETGAVLNGKSTVLEEFSHPATAVSAIWDRKIRNQVTASQIPEQVLNNERAKYVLPKALDLRSCTSRVPVIVIHHPGENGYGSGWDIIAPLGWGMGFWIPFIYHGAQPAGFDDLCSVNLESGCPTFPCSFPDTKAGSTYEENIREDNLKKYYTYSRAKRPNFKVQGIVTPFFMPWNVLVSDWEKEFLSNPRLLETSNCNIFSSTGCESCDERCYFILRSKKQIMHLQHLCALLAKTRNCLEEDILRCKEAHNALVHSLLEPQNMYLKCLVLVRVKCLFRGTPSNFCGIYLPNRTDLKILKENPKYFGPVEQKHDNAEYSKMPAKKRIKLLKEEAKIESKNLDRPDVKTVISCTDRKMIGFISGGYSRLSGQGYGIGHCVLTGFLAVVETCLNSHLAATILIREQHSSQYRLGRIEVIGSPF